MSWLELATALFDTARAMTGLAANWLIQSSLLISGGLILGCLLRNRGSAIQSAIYRTTLVAVLACPMATWGLSLAGISGWSLQMPEAYRHESLAAVAAVDAPPLIESPVVQTAVPSTEFKPTFDSLQSVGESRAAFELASSQVAQSEKLIRDAPPIAPIVEDAVQGTAIETLAPSVAPAFKVQSFGFVAAAAGVLWLAAGGFLLCRLARAWWKLDRLRRGAWTAEPATLDVCRELSALFHVSPPDVLHSPYLPSPCLAGLRRPAVLLPEAEMSLPVRDVLVHELAHLRRHDCWWNLLRRVATAMLFFQPLLWKLSRRLDSTAEEVCDDYVVQLGGDRQQYAHRLVDIAELSLAPAAAAGVGIVSLRSMLATRVARILDTSRSLSTRAGGLLLGIVLFVGLAATLLVGMVGIKPDQAAAETPQSAEAEAIALDNVSQKAADGEIGIPTNDNVSSAKGDDVVTIRGQVVDENRNPISGATVRLPDDSATGGESVSTNEDGRFAIEFDKAKYNKPEWHQEPWRSARLVATADGFGPTWVEGAELTRTDHHTLGLKRDDVPVRGQILTLEGLPVPHAKLEIWDIYQPHSGNLDDLFKTLRDSPSMFQQHLNRQMSYFSGSLLDLKVDRGTLSRGTLSNAGDSNPVITTDENGHFEIRGIGRERMARLWLQGPNIQSTKINVTTRSEIDPKWQRDDSNDESRSMWDSGAAPPHVQTATFKHFAGPSAPIRGVVRDKETGKPIADIHIGGWLRNTNNHAVAVSDEDGRYELTGLGVEGTFQQLYAGPKEEDRERLPYLGAEKERIAYSVTSPLTESDTTFELTRGIVVRGRVSDAVTRRPVKARVEYMSYENNPHVQALADQLWPYADAMTDENGKFAIAVLPGPGTVAVWTRLSSNLPDHYRPVDPNDFGMPVDDRGMVSTANNGYVSTIHYKAARFIDLKPADTPPFIELTVHPLSNLARVRCIDAEGKPLQGVSVVGHLPWSGDYSPIANAGLEKDRDDRIYVEIADLGAESRKPVVFRHRDRKLAAILFGSRSELRPQLEDLKRADDGAHLLQLKPSASITGKLVNEEGEPVRSGDVELNFVTGDDPQRNGIELGDVPVEQNGRFVIGDLPAGGPYVLAGGSTSVGGGILKRDIQLVAGQTLDLGTLDVTKADRPEPKNATTTESRNAEAKAKSDAGIRGRVIGADGKPVAGAKFYWFRTGVHDIDPVKPRLIATGDDSGQFQFEPPSIGTKNEMAAWEYSEHIVVRAPGHGFVYTSPAALRQQMTESKNLLQALARVVGGAKAATIQLPAAGEPIRGRIVNMDGQPVAGVTVSIRWFAGQESARFWQSDVQADGGAQAELRARVNHLLAVIEPVQLQDVLPVAATNADGRFELRDIGPDTVVQLLIRGEGVQSTELVARNDSIEKVVLEPDRHSDDAKQTVYGREFLHVAGPSTPVEGRVLDLDTGEPIANAVVRAFRIHGNRLHSSRERQQFATRTDGEGRYRITGLPIGADNELVAFATGDVPYVPVGLQADTSLAGDAGILDFRLKRGVWAEGRVFDQETDKPLTGEITYYYFRNNELEQQIRGLRRAYLDGLYWTNSDGEFRVPVLPTRGILAYRYQGRPFAMDENDLDRYPRGDGADDIAGGEGIDSEVMFPTDPHNLIPANYQRVAEVNPTATDTTVRVDMPLFAAKPLKVRIVDKGATAGSEYQVHGITRWGWSRVASREFEVQGLKPREERKVMVYDRGRNLIGGTTAKREDAGPIEVELQPAGSIRGRVVDEDGGPITDATVIPDYDKLSLVPGAGIWAPPNLNEIRTQIPVDAEGRFEANGLIPGWKYSAWASAPRQMGADVMDRGIGRLFDDVTIQPGENLDLGEIRPSSDQPKRADRR
jgi:beta-lactamase regulating signal transducer with metallopeptidase domain/protocatechuate 3,4-dioxygenase beta subunit